MKLSKLPVPERNAAYVRMTKAQRASAIAADVLAQVATDKYHPTAGEYLDFPRSAEGESLQELSEGADFTCKLCAIGGAFMSAVRLSNSFNLSYSQAYSGQVGLSSMWDKLQEAFTRKESRAMEYCFEQRSIGGYLEYAEMTAIRNSSIGTRCFEETDDAERLCLIMRHVIKNSGRFSVKGLPLAPNNPNKEVA
jgi:hypothetical protein